MDFLKNQISRIQQQLGGLSASQKMLAGALAVIMVMTLFYWGRYASQAEMEPVLDQPFASEDISRITAQLAAKQIPYKVSSDKILVPIDRKFEVLADLGYSQLLPRDTKSGFDEIVKQLNPFNPDTTNRVMWNRAKEITLAQVIRNFPNVSNAVVIIDPTQERRIGNSVEPCATVNITMRSGMKPGKQLINAAADVVSGAQAALSRSRITVVVDGVSYPIRDQEEGMFASSDAIELRQQHERYFADKIGNMLRYIPGAMVSVTVDVDMKKSQAVKHKVDPIVIQKETKISTETEETTASAPPSGEPGALPNVGMTAGSTNAPGSSQASEKNVTEFQNYPSDMTETVITPAGIATVTAAAVRIPRSYFASIFKANNPNAKEPDDVTLQPLVSAELTKIRNQVKADTGLKDEAAITVETYMDLANVMGAATAPASASASVTSLLGAHVKEVAIGALAVISLLMVSTMVRKSTPAPVIPEQTEPAMPQSFTAGEAIAGEVGEGNPAMDGMEVDEDAVKAQQMLSQVQDMVQENPDAAATLVKRWLSRS